VMSQWAEEISDEQCMAHLAGPEVETALTTLYDRYIRTVFGVGLKVLGNRSLAEEMVQEVFLKVWRSSHTFDPSRSCFSTWLYKLMRRVALDLHRKSARKIHPVSNGDPYIAAISDSSAEPQEAWMNPGCPGEYREPWKASTRHTGRL
jgi:RNA polymerase sigma-70 factor, ECF subfamily